jgi:hypothetical protein
VLDPGSRRIVPYRWRVEENLCPRPPPAIERREQWLAVRLHPNHHDSLHRGRWLVLLESDWLGGELDLALDGFSANTDLTIPTASYALTDATDFDLGFSIDRAGNVYAFIGAQLVGYIPQSGSGSVTPNKRGVASFVPTLTTANLNLTLALQSGTASSKTMSADFILGSKER